MAARQHPHYLMGVLTLLLAFVAGSFIHSALPPGNPEGTDAEEISLKIAGYRRRLDSTATGEIKKEAVERYAAEGQCVLGLMDLIETDEFPGNPTAPRKPAITEIHGMRAYPMAMRDYKCMVDKEAQRRKLWEENKKRRKEYVEAYIGCEKVKYIYFPNLHGYVSEPRLLLISGTAYKMLQSKHWANQMTEFKAGFETFRKEKGLSSKQKPAEAVKSFHEFFVEHYMKQPLTCPKDIDGACLKSWYGTTKEDHSGGEDCLMLKFLADGYTRANARLAKATQGKDKEKKPIQISTEICWRSNLHQAIMYVMVTGSGCRLGYDRPGITLPGTSHHGSGLAADVLNWEVALPYIANETGSLGGILSGDKAHTGWAEFSPDSYWARKRKLDLEANGGKILDVGRELLGL